MPSEPARSAENSLAGLTHEERERAADRAVELVALALVDG